MKRTFISSLTARALAQSTRRRGLRESCPSRIGRTTLQPTWLPLRFAPMPIKCFKSPACYRVCSAQPPPLAVFQAGCMILLSTVANFETRSLIALDCAVYVRCPRCGFQVRSCSAPIISPDYDLRAPFCLVHVRRRKSKTSYKPSCDWPISNL